MKTRDTLEILLLFFVTILALGYGCLAARICALSETVETLENKMIGHDYIRYDFINMRAELLNEGVLTRDLPVYNVSHDASICLSEYTYTNRSMKLLLNYLNLEIVSPVVIKSKRKIRKTKCPGSKEAFVSLE